MNPSSKSDNESPKIFIYSIVLIILSYWLMDFFTMSWQKGLFKILFPDSYGAVSFILAIIAGVYYGILVVTLKRDFFKRIQSVYLIFFSLFVTFFHIYSIYTYYIYFFPSLLLTYYHVDKLDPPSSCRYKEHLKSIKERPLFIVLIITSGFVTLAMINFLLGYYYTSTPLPSKTIDYVIYSAFFIGVFIEFMNYKTESGSIFVVGPSRVGKTTFMAALCDKLNGDPNNELGATLNDMKDEGWPRATTDMTLFDFFYHKGILFTKCISISTYDYSGLLTRDLYHAFQALEKISAVKGSSDFQDLVETKINLINELPNTVLNKDDTAKIIYKIAMSSKLIFVISAVSIKRQDPKMVGTSKQPIWGSEYKDYMKVYELIAKVTDKPFVIVVNKVDQEYSAKLRPTTPLNNVARWILEDMKKKSNTFFINQKKVIKRENSYNDDSSLIFPCWIPEENDVPTIKNGKLSTIGYDEIIKVL